MSEPIPSILDTVDDPTISDPLSEVTRKERRALLASSIVGFAISAGGLVPEKIDAFGISVTPKQEESLLLILGGLIAYFLFAFAIYAASDVKRRETASAKAGARVAPLVQERVGALKRVQASLRGRKPSDSNAGNALLDPELLEMARIADQARFAKRVKRIADLRLLFDAYLPLVVGLTAVIVVWSSTKGFPGWRWVGIGALVALVIVLFIVAVLKWEGWMKAVKKRKSKRRMAKQKRLTAEAKKFPEGDPRRERMLAEARELLMQSVEDLKNGIF